MMSAPRTGCVRSRRESNASAGGQLEQPSEVNSSTRTGVDAASGAFDVAGTSFMSAAAEPVMPGLRAIRARSTTAATKTVIVLGRRLIKLLPRTSPTLSPLHILLRSKLLGG